MEVKLVVVTPEAELNIVRIARVSSSREDKDEAPEGLINYLIKNKHWSPFEHSSMTIEIKTSKAIGIQLLRHRSFTFQEFSQRYAKVTEIEPIEIRRQADKNRQSSEEVFDPRLPDGYYNAPNHSGLSSHPLMSNASILIEEYIDEGQKLYNALIDADVAKECARMILPMATSTTIYMTGTIRSWIHFLEIRDDAHAQKEVQLIAKEIKKIFIEQLPLVSSARGYKN